MLEKVQINKHAKLVSNAVDLDDNNQSLQKQVYNAPRFVNYGPLAKNITLGFLSGAETDSTFAV